MNATAGSEDVRQPPHLPSGLGDARAPCVLFTTPSTQQREDSSLEPEHGSLLITLGWMCSANLRLSMRSRQNPSWLEGEIQSTELPTPTHPCQIYWGQGRPCRSNGQCDEVF